MSKYYFYHPLGENYARANQDQPGKANTYGTHGIGKLDMGRQQGESIYSMADGVVTFNGTYSTPPGCTAISIETNCGAIAPVTMRYLHGDWDQSLTVGTQIKRGQKIGTENGNGGGGSHLHIDISTVGDDFDPVYGTIDGNTYTVTHGGSGTFAIDAETNMDLINTWKSQYSVGGANIGYNWLIFASKFVQITGDDSGTAGATSITMSAQDFYNKTQEKKGYTGDATHTLAAMKLMNGLMANGCNASTAAILGSVTFQEKINDCISDNSGLSLNNNFNDVKITWGTGDYRSPWAWMTSGASNAAKLIDGDFSADERNVNSKVDSTNIMCRIISEIATKGQGSIFGNSYWFHSDITGWAPNLSQSEQQQVLKTGLNSYMAQHPTEILNGVHMWEAFYEHHKGGANDYGGGCSPRAIAFAHALGVL